MYKIYILSQLIEKICKLFFSLIYIHKQYNFGECFRQKVPNFSFITDLIIEYKYFMLFYYLYFVKVQKMRYIEHPNIIIFINIYFFNLYFRTLWKLLKTFLIHYTKYILKVLENVMGFLLKSHIFLEFKYSRYWTKQ